MLILETGVSVLVFLSVALSSKSKIFETVEFSNVLVAFISIIFSKFKHPDNTESFSFATKSSDSPVKAEVSNLVSPLTIIPSVGIFSPFLIIKISPTLMFSKSIFLIPFFLHEVHKDF